MELVLNVNLSEAESDEVRWDTVKYELCVSTSYVAAELPNMKSRLALLNRVVLDCENEGTEPPLRHVCHHYSWPRIKKQNKHKLECYV
jgi:hypothetical protein